MEGLEGPAGPVKKRGGFPFKKRAVEPEPESPEAREAREAAERLLAEKAARVEEIGAAWAAVAARVRAALPSADDYRQIYFLSLVRQGREAAERERPAVANHCLAVIDRGLAALTSADVHSVTNSSKISASSGSNSSGSSSGSSSALVSLKSRWDAAARDRAAALLVRHAKRLSPAEREAYAASLETLSAEPLKASAQPLRRKLVERLLRAEAYRRRGARLSGWTKAPVPATGPAGPYNDFAALEQTVQRIAVSHPEWAAEFLDLYAGMNRIRSAYQTLLPAGKKS
jgi:hypothetical protein